MCRETRGRTFLGNLPCFQEFLGEAVWVRCAAAVTITRVRVRRNKIHGDTHSLRVLHKVLDVFKTGGSRAAYLQGRVHVFDGPCGRIVQFQVGVCVHVGMCRRAHTPTGQRQEKGSEHTATNTTLGNSPFGREFSKCGVTLGWATAGQGHGGTVHGTCAQLRLTWVVHAPHLVPHLPFPR